MVLKAAIWRPIALVLGALNLLGAGYATASGEPLHATIHAALALGFGWWARRLRTGPGGRELQAGLASLEALEGEVTMLRQEVSELHERVDFAERLLAQRPETRQEDLQR
jgi:hypothetical protein